MVAGCFCSGTRLFNGFAEQLGFLLAARVSRRKEHREMLDRQWMIEHEAKVRETIWQREELRDERNERGKTNETGWLENAIGAKSSRSAGLLRAATIIGGILSGLVSRGVWLWAVLTSSARVWRPSDLQEVPRQTLQALEGRSSSLRAGGFV